MTPVHLQNRGRISTRLDQSDALPDAQADTPIVVIAGDFDSQPGAPEIERMIDASLVGAQDVSGVDQR